MVTVENESMADAYLRRLDRAARWLPRDQASELHEQIEFHLAETLPPDCDQQQLREAIAQLGEPHLLVREAAGRRRRLRTRLRRVRWWTWAICGIVIAGLVSTVTLVAVTLIPEYRAPDMSCGCYEAFTSHSDGIRARHIDAGIFDANEIALRSNHQGFEFDVYNSSHVSQTILGLAGRPLLSYKRSYTLRIGRPDRDGTPLVPATSTAAPVTLRPGEDRTLAITWNHLDCSMPGAEDTLTGVQLHVRIGPFTRTENIELPPLIFRVPKPSTTTPATRCIPAAAHSSH